MEGFGAKSVEELDVGDLESAGLEPSEALHFYQELQVALQRAGFGKLESIWRLVSQSLLTPRHPHALHQLMYYSIYKNWDELQCGPPPYWFPSLEIARSTSIGQLLEARGNELLGNKAHVDPIASFTNFYKFSVQHPEIFWSIAFEKLSLHFSVEPKQMVDSSDSSRPAGKWLPGAVLNVAHCCLLPKPSIGKTDDRIAIKWRDEGGDDLPPSTMKLWELRHHVSRVAFSLQAAGFQRGDRIAIDMPMHIHAVIIYLAIILAGCVVVSIADSFVSSEIAARLAISKAKGIFTQDVIVRGGKAIPLYSRVLGAKPPKAVVLPSDGKSVRVPIRNQDVSWEEFFANGNGTNRYRETIENLGALSLRFICRSGDEFPAVQLPVESWTNILFSSGTTAEPKAIPWNQTTPMRCAADSWAHFDLQAGDIYCWPTNLGWMVGPYIISACLLSGATMALYNGSPLGRSFGRFVQDARVTILGTVPSMVKTWKKVNCMDSLDWSSIRSFGTTGEASSIDDDLWLSARAWYKPILECCGGTELGSAFLHGSLLQPQAFAAFSTPSLTAAFVLLDDSGRPYPDDQPCSGEIALFPKLLGASYTLLNADHHKVYFEGMPVINGIQLRRHGDVFERIAGGFYKAKGRADDTMNLGGIKVSSVEIERVCNTAHSSVLETAAIAMPQGKGGGPDNLIVAAVLKGALPPGENHPEMLKRIFLKALHDNLNPLFKVHAVVLRPEFPRTASNKIMRRVLRAQMARSKL
ncbi:probable acyl-activating enzyme 18, peroxisomal isoform X1 [Selaginella moellendorffii]|uniref:probable acyl-activating enzyme 18, peroxisomal isoform X1 n=1 Tax=Selaginella moellendorffii TaxID=88036 RepID=UPI000D1C4A94|nr:probable acyl-activating enzyme 18, peroxisomal isoform X1 [Selaginella moellendorffii]|eukprot:XP_024519246.1 probable acyl-activating enzyme 18, peroxisomal isoform X1 [Selaginella moellendorffii]